MAYAGLLRALVSSLSQPEDTLAERGGGGHEAKGFNAVI